MIDTKQLVVPKQQATKALSAANALSITSNDELIVGVELLGRIKTAQKAITDKKQAITKPINEALKEIRSLFAPIEKSIDEAEGIVKNKMLVYNETTEQAAREQEAKIAARVEKGTLKPETAANKIAAIERVQPTTTGNNGAAQFVQLAR